MLDLHACQLHDRPQGGFPPARSPGRPGDQIRGEPAPARSPGQPGDQIRGGPAPAQSPGQPDDQIRRFFDVFSRASDTLDLDALAGCFDETFLSSDTAATRVLPLQAFLGALAGRAQMFADAGLGPAALRQLTCRELDLHHVLARTTWAAPRTDGSGEVTLASSFLLRRDGDRLRIVAYINHQGLPS